MKKKLQPSDTGDGSDTNIFLQSLINPDSIAARCLETVGDGKGILVAIGHYELGLLWKFNEH